MRRSKSRSTERKRRRATRKCRQRVVSCRDSWMQRRKSIEANTIDELRVRRGRVRRRPDARAFRERVSRVRRSRGGERVQREISVQRVRHRATGDPRLRNEMK